MQQRCWDHFVGDRHMEWLEKREGPLEPLVCHILQHAVLWPSERAMLGGLAGGRASCSTLLGGHCVRGCLCIGLVHSHAICAHAAGAEV
jgi:hypothetical protein